MPCPTSAMEGQESAAVKHAKAVAAAMQTVSGACTYSTFTGLVESIFLFNLDLGCRLSLLQRASEIASYHRLSS